MARVGCCLGAHLPRLRFQGMLQLAAPTSTSQLIAQISHVKSHPHSPAFSHTHSHTPIVTLPHVLHTTGAAGIIPSSTSASDLQRAGAGAGLPPPGPSAPIVGGAALLAAQKAAELAAQHAASAAAGSTGAGGRRSKWDAGGR